VSAGSYAQHCAAMSRRPALSRALALMASMAVVGAVAAAAQEPVATVDPVPEENPCQVPGNQLACPDLIMRKPTALSLRPGGGRRILRSTNAIINIGHGPLEIHASRQGTRGREMAARQAIHARTGKNTLLRAADGEVYFEFVPGRRRGYYWKFEDAANFELYRLDADGYRVERVRRSPKIYYCFRDLQKVRSYARSPRRFVYPACSQRGSIRNVTLGTSVGWADIYPSRYPENWIDVTGLRGCFAYVHVADPEHHLVEEREDNNSAQRTVRLPWRGPRLKGCPHARPGSPDVR